MCTKIKQIEEYQNELSLNLLGMNYAAVIEFCTEHAILDINRKASKLYLEQFKQQPHRTTDDFNSHTEHIDEECNITAKT